MFTMIMSTIGNPFIKDALKSMEGCPPPELIVVVDKVGRTASNLDNEYPLSQLEADLAASPCKPKLVYHDPAPDKWAVMNGCYNVGWRLAKHDYVMFTHDDLLYAPNYDYNAAINPVLKAIDADGGIVMGKKVMGIVLPHWEILNRVIVPMYGEESGTGKDWVLCQVYNPVAHILHKRAMEEMGGFDEEFGIWYDGQMQIESFQRDWWYIHLPTALCQHESVKTFRTNNWGSQWAINPKWGQYPHNFVRKYGVEWARNLSLKDGIPITDPRFGVPPPP